MLTRLTRRGTLAVVAGAALITTVAACGGGGGGGGSDEQQIRDAITTFTSKRTCAVLDVKARKALLGETALAACNHAASLGAKPGKYAIVSVAVHGASAVAHIKGAGVDRTVSMVRQGGKWMIDDISQQAGAGSATTATGAATTPPTSPAAPSDASGTAAARYQAALTTFTGAESSINSGLSTAGNDIAKVHTFVTLLRASLAAFDSEVRLMTFPSSAQADADRLLAADATAIRDLDAVSKSQSVAEFRRLNQSSAPVGQDIPKVGDLANKVAHDLAGTP